MQNFLSGLKTLLKELVYVIILRVERKLVCATMFVPIRREPIMFRESFSDASALQKNVKYCENFQLRGSFSCRLNVKLIEYAMKSIFG